MWSQQLSVAEKRICLQCSAMFTSYLWSKNAPTLQFVRSPICVCTSNCVISWPLISETAIYSELLTRAQFQLVRLLVANRLVQHLKTLGIHNGESMHSFRSGCSITLSLLGVTSEEVARHVGWRSLDTAEYYSIGSPIRPISSICISLATLRNISRYSGSRVEACLFHPFVLFGE